MAHPSPLPTEPACRMLPSVDRFAELDRLGDEIALLSAHLDAAAARLLVLIREFDARGGWGNGLPLAPTGSPGASASISAPPAKRSASPAPSPPSRCSPRLSRVASCPTPRSAPSLAWPPLQRRPGSSLSAARAPPSTPGPSPAAGGRGAGSP